MAHTSEPSDSPTPLSVDSEPESGRQPIRVLVIGSKKGVISTIRTLYVLGFAQVYEWSPLLPAPKPEQVMSILTR